MSCETGHCFCRKVFGDAYCCRCHAVQCGTHCFCREGQCCFCGAVNAEKKAMAPMVEWLEGKGTQR